MANAAGFRPLSRPGVGELPFEYEQMTDAEGASLGEALVLTNGKLTKAGATVTPQFVAVKSAAVATPGATIPVWRVDELQEWTTQSNATTAATLIGQKVTLHTDGLLVTATTTSGVFEISETDGATTTSNVRGRFRR
jgi:hypothetical protein